MTTNPAMEDLVQSNFLYDLLELNESFLSMLDKTYTMPEYEGGAGDDAEELQNNNDRYTLPVILIVCSLGTVFNLINILVLTRKRMSSSTAMLLTGLAVADMTAVVVDFSNALDKYLNLDRPEHFQTFGRVLLGTLHVCLFNTVSTISNWMTVVIGIWRYIAVTWPLRAKGWCTRERARIAITSTYLFSVVLCLPIFLSFKFEAIDSVRYILSPSDLALRHNQLLTKIVWGVVIFSRLVPCCILTAITICLIRSLCLAGNARRILRQGSGQVDSVSKGDRTTGMLLVVLVLFLVSNLPFAICNVLHRFMEERFFYDFYLIFFDILQICVLINHSINFVVYCFLSENFRQTLFQFAPAAAKFGIVNSFRSSTSTTKV